MQPDSPKLLHDIRDAAEDVGSARPYYTEVVVKEARLWKRS